MLKSSQNNRKFISGDLVTDWAFKVDPNEVFPEYPRPQFKRDVWLNLNGLWDYAVLCTIIPLSQFGRRLTKHGAI